MEISFPDISPSPVLLYRCVYGYILHVYTYNILYTCVVYTLYSIV